MHRPWQEVDVQEGGLTPLLCGCLSLGPPADLHIAPLLQACGAWATVPAWVTIRMTTWLARNDRTHSALLPTAPLTCSPTYRFGGPRPCPRQCPPHTPSIGNTRIEMPRYCLDWPSSREHRKIYGRRSDRNHYFMARARVPLSLLENQRASLRTLHRSFGHSGVKHSSRLAKRGASHRLQPSSVLVFMKSTHPQEPESKFSASGGWRASLPIPSNAEDE